MKLAIMLTRGRSRFREDTQRILMTQALRPNISAPHFFGTVYASPQVKEPYIAALTPTTDDIDLLRKMTRGSMSNENFDQDKYLNELIPKPWGHEYRIYTDNIYDVWKLRITPGGQTSLHCHP